MLQAADAGFGPPWEWAGGDPLRWLIRRNTLQELLAEKTKRDTENADRQARRYGRRPR